MQKTKAVKRTGRHRRSGSGYISRNKVELVRGGRPYFDKLIQMINQAEQIIQLQVYIYDDDETGKEVTAALTAAAKRKVSVYLMADGYASQKLSKKFIRDVEDAGVHFRFFEPLFRSRNSYFGRRLHHKVLVTDNRFALVGGINVSNNYNDMPGNAGWLDFALHVEGEIVKELCRICQKIWVGYLIDKRLNFCHDSQITLNIKPEQDSLLRVRRNDWITKRNQISRSYIEMFRKANKEIIMMSGYFLPGPVMRKNMKKATRRGVKIKLILAGISDVVVAKNAERYMYNWLFRNNIEVYEYKPSVLHGKVAVYDSSWATIGSYNLNIISAYASIELNIDINQAEFATMLQATLENIIVQNCTRITREDFILHNTIFSKIWEQLCYWFIRFLFYIFTFNFKQRDN
jgi:cardiolipin synthase A/B